MRRGVISNNLHIETDLPEGLVHYWKMDGDLLDSVSGASLTDTNSTYTFVYDAFVERLVLSNTYGAAPAMTFLHSAELINSDVTVCFWYYYGSSSYVNGYPILLFTGTTSQYSIEGFRMIGMNSHPSSSIDRSFLQHYNKGGYRSSPMIPASYNTHFNSWAHFRFEFQKNIPEWRFYKNNVRMTGGIGGTWVPDPIIAATQLSQLGCMAINHKMSDLRIYKRLLSSNEIDDIMEFEA